ncbi:hypothetical protein BX600DRAFT_442194 [Xylariales sp. PMI_506]|nr:hypothetical protein BX600DRAFT_442194 [Xylariales sp. PMI_506]
MAARNLVLRRVAMTMSRLLCLVSALRPQDMSGSAPVSPRDRRWAVLLRSLLLITYQRRLPLLAGSTTFASSCQAATRDTTLLGTSPSLSALILPKYLVDVTDPPPGDLVTDNNWG